MLACIPTACDALQIACIAGADGRKTENFHGESRGASRGKTPRRRLPFWAGTELAEGDRDEGNGRERQKTAPVEIRDAAV